MPEVDPDICMHSTIKGERSGEDRYMVTCEDCDSYMMFTVPGRTSWLFDGEEEDDEYDEDEEDEDGD